MVGEHVGYSVLAKLTLGAIDLFAVLVGRYKLHLMPQLKSSHYSFGRQVYEYF